MRAFSGDVQARWQARRDRTDAEAVHQPRARTGVPNQQFLASTVRAVDGHNRRLAERSRGSDGATGAPRDGDAEGRRSDMLDERLDWAARKAAAAAAAAVVMLGLALSTCCTAVAALIGKAYVALMIND